VPPGLSIAVRFLAGVTNLLSALNLMKHKAKYPSRTIAQNTNSLNITSIYTYIVARRGKPFYSWWY